MSLELVVNARENGSIWIALLNEGHLVELHEEKGGDSDFAVGDIYLGKVRKVVPNLNACFVNVGYEKDAFLHYLDLGPQFRSMNKFSLETLNGKQTVPDLQYFKSDKDIDKNGKITDIITTNKEILVQVAKEPISQKGPRLTSEITLAGRFIVLVPFSNKISVSQKIKERQERNRLRDILKSLLPKNFGVIIRTVAENKKIAEIDTDLKGLIEKWNKLHRNLKGSKSPKRVLGEINRASSLLRDTLNDNFTKIHVNDPDLLNEMGEYIRTIAPAKVGLLKPYKSSTDIFETFGINRQIKIMFGKKVPMPSGGYLIIEQTEAMHVIDVNSGNRNKKTDSQEENAVAVNLEAAAEIARLLRLRDMGGIICIDFIDMHRRENNKKLFEALKSNLQGDRAKHSIIPPSKFGVVEITRQRVRPATKIETAEVCPTCDGTGKISASIMYAEEIENKLTTLIEDRGEKNFTLHVHPYLQSYFTQGIFSRRWKWFKKYKKWIKIVGDNSNHLLQYKFVGKNGAVIEI